MFSTAPSTFGYPTETTQANYYPGEHCLSQHEIGLVSKVLEAHNIKPENTRVIKRYEDDQCILDVLQASTVTACVAKWDGIDGEHVAVRLSGGNHHEEMSKICGSLLQARELASNETTKGHRPLRQQLP
jgi:hypothetical protein